MIPITIKDYKTKVESWIELYKEVEESGIESIDELKEKVPEEYRAILVYTEISEKDIKDFSLINSKFDDIFLARIKNTFFIFGKEKLLMEYFEKIIAKSLESVLNLKNERLEKIIEEYEKLIDNVHREKKKVESGETLSLKPLDELSKKNEQILHLLKQDEKRLEHLKELSNTEKYNGVFNSLLREIEEEKIYGIETSIKTSSDAANLLIQHHTLRMNQKGIEEMVSLEKALEGLYLVIGTYYITHLILLLIESYYGAEHHIQFLPMLLIIIGAFLLSYISLKFLKKIIRL